MSAPWASVLIPTRAPGARIEQVLRAVFEQRTGFTFEVRIVDSGSTDADLRRMRQFPVALSQILPGDFGHGRTRNLLAQQAQGQILLYLSQDAQPIGATWMHTLVGALAQPNVAGAYARQVARPDADPFARFFAQDMYGPEACTRRLVGPAPPQLAEMFFSNVSSAVRRAVWQRIPFREDVRMSEDQHWAYDALRAGFQLAYQPAAMVYHSHNYGLRQLFQRHWSSGLSLRGLIADSSGAVFGRGMAYVLDEARYFLRHGHAGLLPYLALYEATRGCAFAAGSFAADVRAMRSRALRSAGR